MGHWEERKLPTGGTERIHYESDGRPSGLREFSNPNNNLSKKDYDSLMDAYYTDQDPGYKGRCTCGGTYRPHEYTTRASNNFLGVGRKGTVKNARKCDGCGRIDHV
jgi:hypothetical protein